MSIEATSAVISFTISTPHNHTPVSLVLICERISKMDYHAVTKGFARHATQALHAHVHTPHAFVIQAFSMIHLSIAESVWKFVKHPEDSLSYETSVSSYGR